MQNTAKVTQLLKDRREIDLFPARYNILGSQHNRADIMATSTEKYAKDPEPYFPYIDPNKDHTPKVEVPKMERDATYSKDKSAYYNPTGVLRKIPTQQIGKVVPVEMKDLRDSFPSNENLQFLKNKLKAIEIRENSYPDKGIYPSDPRPYYDTSVDDTKSEVSQIVNNMTEMKKNLENAAKNTVKAEVKTVRVKNQIQNQSNYDAEARQNKQQNNYYTPVQNQNGFNVELPVGTVLPKSTKVQTSAPVGDKVSADEVKHDVVEAEEKAVSRIAANSKNLGKKESKK